MEIWVVFCIKLRHTSGSPLILFNSYLKLSRLVISNNDTNDEEDGWSSHSYPLNAIGELCSSNKVLSEVYHYLISTGCNVESRNRYRQTTLLFSTRQFGINNNLWIPILLENGADTTAVDEFGRTGLHH